MKRKRTSRPIAKLALKQRSVLEGTDGPTPAPTEAVDNRPQLCENLGREGGTLSPSRGEDPPLKGPPPSETVKKPCGCGGDPNPSAAKPAGPRLTPREQLQAWLEQNVRHADKEGKAKEEAQLALFNELLTKGHIH